MTRLLPTHMTVTGSVVKEWALTIKEQPEGIDLTTLPSYDGGQEIEGVLLFMNTITIQPAKSRHGTPNNPVRYELRIEVGSASPPHWFPTTSVQEILLHMLYE